MKYIEKLFFPLLSLHKDFSVPSQYESELVENKKQLNLEKIKVIVKILILIDIGLVYIDFYNFYNLWNVNVNYRYLFYSHVIILILLGLYSYLLFDGGKSFHGKAARWLKDGTTISVLFILIVLLWGTFLAINAQGFHQQISAYIICIFGLASFLIMRPKHTFMIYISIHIIFVIGILMVQDDFHEVAGHLINGTITVVLAFIISKYKYYGFIKDFINKKEIEEKNLLLNNSHQMLEKAIEERTEELKASNEMLIEEITRRHKVEIKAIEGRLLYEEKTREFDEAMKYDKLRTIFFTNLSHELRTPLNVIFAAQQTLDLILKSPISENDQMKMKKHSKSIKQNCYRLIRLINNLIDITKMDAGCFDVQLSNHNFVKIVEDITLSVATYIEGKNIDLVFDTEVEERNIACDPDIIERIVLNLLSNAVKFTPEGGGIYVNIFLEKNYIILSVKDTGMGIPIGMQERIFERFIQVDRSMKRSREGSGIGLALVKQLMEAHHGSISLISQEGYGSEFILKFPDNSVLKGNNEDFYENNKGQEKDAKGINVEFSDIYL